MNEGNRKFIIRILCGNFTVKIGPKQLDPVRKHPHTKLTCEYECSHATAIRNGTKNLLFLRILWKLLLSEKNSRTVGILMH